VITIEDARQIVATSPTMLEMYSPGSFRVQNYGWRVRLCVICDNYATYKHPNVQAWLDKISG
jgi:hypothetical protein